MTDIQSAIFDDGWQERMSSSYGDLQWAPTGERLTQRDVRRTPEDRRPGHPSTQHARAHRRRQAVASPLTIIASDGILQNGKGHPRASGTYARVLGRYVRETHALTLAEAIRKMCLLPAQRLERIAPAFLNKGRLAVGADADVAVFDPATVTDRSTYQQPSLPSEGFRFVVVNGIPVIVDGRVRDGVYPGRGLRGPAR